tara:strand:+ start:51 stop:197 length:147 start_codon:yes stop_codon:yes gene_type:complete
MRASVYQGTSDAIEDGRVVVGGAERREPIQHLRWERGGRENGGRKERS